MGILVHIAVIAFIGCTYANPLEFNSDSSRISNGINAAENQFRHAISLQFLSPVDMQSPTRGHRCGGALITLGHALTAASCLFDDNDGVPSLIAHHQFRVFAGSVFLNNDAAERWRMIANFSIHPNYLGPPAFVNDIAIIILVQPFHATIVTPLALPAANWNPADFSECQVAGWGARFINETGNTQLQFANKYVYNQHLCSTLFNSQYGIPNILPTMVCAASFDIVSGGCINDEGNALVCGGTLTGILFIHDHCRASSFPEIYTRVSNYSAWIRTISASPALFTPTVFLMVVTFSIAQLFLNKH